MYAVGLHPNGGIQFAGVDLNGRSFSLRLDPQTALVSAGEFERLLFAHMAHNKVRDDRPPHDTVSEGIEKT